MAISTQSTNFDHGSDAAFRAYGSKVNAGLAAIGMVQTADTGQINWTTVVRPGASTWAGSEVWRFNDALQATAPLYFKIWYGTGTNVAYVMMSFTWGKGSDGAGNLTGGLPGGANIVPAFSTAGAAYSSYFCSGDGSMMCMALNPGMITSGAAFLGTVIIDRSRTASGTPTGAGVVLTILTSKGGQGGVHAIKYSTGTGLSLTAGSLQPLVNIPGNGIALAGGGDIPVFPTVVTDGTSNFWQPRSHVGCSSLDVPVGTIFNVPGWGNYIGLGGGGFVTGRPTNESIAMAWY